MKVGLKSKLLNLMEINKRLGFTEEGKNASSHPLDVEKIKLQLLMLGQPVEQASDYLQEVVEPMMASYVSCLKHSEKIQCAADKRIEGFLDHFFEKKEKCHYLPEVDFICDQFGIARLLSLPENEDEFHSEYAHTYRTTTGILNNPGTDKRTTKDVFHVVEGGLPIPSDKKAVPKSVFEKMLMEAFHPSDDLMLLPFTSKNAAPVKAFVSGYIKPVICPGIDEKHPEKRMEIRMFLPGSMVSILDCVESIFGNFGSPMLPENDMAVFPETWTGHTGCIVFAPQLRKLTKKYLGLPDYEHATDRQRRDGMCWKSPDELYHDGKPFKIMACDGGDVIVSIVADSYNGYGKKEIKTQMSYAANRMGICEEEHSGGSILFPQYDLGDEFVFTKDFKTDHTIESVQKLLGDRVEWQSDGLGQDRRFREIFYVPEEARFHLPTLSVSWTWNGAAVTHTLKLGNIYVLPSGYQVYIVKPEVMGGRWRLIGRVPNGIFCYKPATVSGGGKSEIAKEIDEFITSGPTLVHNYEEDCKQVESLMGKDYSHRFKDPSRKDDRRLMDADRSLGSVIKLLTPNDYYTDEYNQWLGTVPQHILEMIFAIKRFWKDLGGRDWRSLFSVDTINGATGNELIYNGSRLQENYLRVGFDKEGNKRLFTLRDDFIPSKKFQLADDITASTVVPSADVPYADKDRYLSVKVVHNCEYRLYQRPDEALVPGYDMEAENDMVQENMFTCNFQPLTREDVQKMMEDRMTFENYSLPMKQMLEHFVEDEHGPRYAVCPSHTRLLDNGTRTKNQRYLQSRKDLCNHKETYLTNLSLQLWKKMPYEFQATQLPVDEILSGRRNNPPEPGVPPLCVYSPLHYMDTPELFMEYISSMTGKSPSTTGAGLEGPMTKGPFNCLPSVYDLNNALLSFILTGYHGFLSAAGYVGPKYKVAHDITYLLPEIWSRMTVEERTPSFLIEHGYLERCENFEYHGKVVPFERMGYRITRKFVRIFAGRIFSSPNTVFTDDMLCPEQQDPDIFAASMDAIVEAHQRSAKLVLETGEQDAIPPLKALLHIIVDGEYEGMHLRSASFRQMFQRENVIHSEWYQDRLRSYQQYQLDHYNKSLQYLKNGLEFFPEWLASPAYISAIQRIANQFEYISTEDYRGHLVGTIGR